MSLEDIAKRNADQTRLDRMKRVNVAAKKSTIQNGTYLGKAEDGTDIVMIDGQIGATSGHRLISDKNISEGDRVQLRPSENGLQRVDAKNQPPVTPQEAVEPPIYEYYFETIESIILISNDLDTYEIPLQTKGTKDIAIKSTGTPSGINFEFKPDSGSYSSISISGSETAISGSGTLKITYLNSDQADAKDLQLTFYNGRVVKDLRAITFIRLYDARTVPAFGSWRVEIYNRLIAKPLATKTIANAIKLKYAVDTAYPSLFSLNVNATSAIIVNPNTSAPIPFNAYPVFYPIDLLGLASYPPIASPQKISLTEYKKGVGVKGMDSVIYRMLPQPAKMRYRFNIPTTSLGDIFYTDSAPSSPAVGDLYTFIDSGITDASWGAATAVEKFDQVYWDGSAWQFWQTGYYYFKGLDTAAIATRDGSLSLNIDTVNYSQTGLSLTVTNTDSAINTSAELSFSFLNISRWIEFNYRYRLGELENELLTIEATCNEQVLTQDLAANPDINPTFNFTGLAETSVFNFSIRFKRKLGSTWFQV